MKAGSQLLHQLTKRDEIRILHGNLLKFYSFILSYHILSHLSLTYLIISMPVPSPKTHLSARSCNPLECPERQDTNQFVGQIKCLVVKRILNISKTCMILPSSIITLRFYPIEFQ